MDDKEAKVIIDMLKELQGNMDSFRADMKEMLTVMKADLKEMCKDLRTYIQEIREDLRVNMQTRFDTIENSLDKVEKHVESDESKHNSIGQQFEETEKALQLQARTQRETENAVQRTQDFFKITLMDIKQEILSLKMEQVSHKVLNESVRYLTHKLQEIDMELHAMRKK